MSESATLLKYARREAGLTQRELARRLGVSQAADRKDGASRLAIPRARTLDDVLRATGRRLDARRSKMGRSGVEREASDPAPSPGTVASRLATSRHRNYVYSRPRMLVLAGARSPR